MITDLVMTLLISGTLIFMVVTFVYLIVRGS